MQTSRLIHNHGWGESVPEERGNWLLDPTYYICVLSLKVAPVYDLSEGHKLGWKMTALASYLSHKPGNSEAPCTRKFHLTVY